MGIHGVAEQLSHFVWLMCLFSGYSRTAHETKKEKMSRLNFKKEMKQMYAVPARPQKTAADDQQTIAVWNITVDYKRITRNTAIV